MISMTIRDIRQRWPEAEKALAEEDEIVITRDGKPVAKLIPFMESEDKRPRFNPEKHLQKMKKILGGRVLYSNDKGLAARRVDRFGR
jgi:antitoxin (DNA-binding transcriptional repressor) of toxin-antitoxin stability system